MYLDGGSNDIIVHSDDVQIMMYDKELIVMSSISYTGKDAAQEVAKLVIEDFKSEQLSLRDADSILIYFTLHNDFSIMDIALAVDTIHNTTDENIFSSQTLLNQQNIIFGIVCNDEFTSDHVKINVFVSYSTIRPCE